ncbi:MAG: indole-3-glycerol phosphate synthase TrpC [Dehalococcoidia bacterium]|nr:indole-3-glycerol phosphate synthase TrpC [Dehalococcoidia bacterium]
MTETGSILDRIVADTRDLRERQKRDEPAAALRDRASQYDAQFRLTDAIISPRGHAPASAAVQIVAEIKKASPSRGVFVADLDYLRIARDYTLGGAAGVSILTEPFYFQGDLAYLRDVRLELAAGFPDARPSLLRKDFLVEPYELLQARAYGADTVLLIAAILDEALLRDLIAEAAALDLDALVEVHNGAEAERAVAAGATLFGINNRDLHTFDVDLATTERIRPLLPHDAVIIGESGVHTRADVARLHAAGVGAILVGEAFMTAPDIAAKMDELRL